jgi:hypothetical protein
MGPCTTGKLHSTKPNLNNEKLKEIQMTTETNAPKLDIANVLIVTPAPEIAIKPQSIQLSGNIAALMQKAAALIRLGYCPVPGLPIPFYSGETGNMVLLLEFGTPDTYSIEQAKQSMADAVAAEASQYLTDVRRAAAAMVANEKAAAQEAAKAKAIADHQAALAKMEADFAASTK